MMRLIEDVFKPLISAALQQMSWLIKWSVIIMRWRNLHCDKNKNNFSQWLTKEIYDEMFIS